MTDAPSPAPATTPVGGGGFTYTEPYAKVQFLPRCFRCEAKHPLACTPKRDPAACWSCGVTLPDPPASRMVKADWTTGDWLLRLGLLLVRFGRWINSRRAK